MSALRHFDAFLRVASKEELDAADKIVASRRQFTVYTNLSDRFRPTPVIQQTSNSQNASQKKGLIWVIALARLEAGAIMGTFTTQANPFEMVGPTRWEMPAYKELLMDGAQMHFLALANDAHVHVVAAKIPDTEMLSYLRRVNLARSMLSPAARSNAQEMSAQAWAEVAIQDKLLLSIRDRFAAKIIRYLDLINSNSTQQIVTETQKSTVNACGSQLEGERRELAAGTARVQTFNYKR